MTSLSIVIPVYNEEAVLRITVPLLLHGLSDYAEIIYVCNGCSDGSAGFLRNYSDSRIKILELSCASKSQAIRAGERLCSTFPRFFIDADVRIHGADLTVLAMRLRNEPIDLISPRLVFDLDGASYPARKANDLWLRLPYGTDAAFQQVIGISEIGRAHWMELPDVTADDSFIVSCIPPERRRIAHDVTAIVRPPATITALIGVRIRILKGLAELEQMGIARPRQERQREALCQALCDSRQLVGAVAYIFVGLVARIAFAFGVGRSGWYRDKTSRKYFGKMGA